MKHNRLFLRLHNLHAVPTTETNKRCEDNYEP